jgi:hypothetical protein
MTEHRSGTSIIEKLRRVVLRPFDRGGESVENTDAMAATGGTKTDPSGAMPHHGPRRAPSRPTTDARGTDRRELRARPRPPAALLARGAVQRDHHPRQPRGLPFLSSSAHEEGPFASQAFPPAT